MMNNSINVPKLDINLKKLDCAFRWYTLHLLKSEHFFELSVLVGLHFFLKHLVYPIHKQRLKIFYWPGVRFSKHVLKNHVPSLRYFPFVLISHTKIKIVKRGDNVNK